MVTELQYVAIAMYLTWCLVSSLSGVLTQDHDEALQPARGEQQSGEYVGHAASS